MSLIGLLVFVLIVVLIFGLIIYFIRTIPMPAPWGIVAQSIVALICILLLLGVLFGGISVPVLRVN
jgi:hypothetical protein